MVQKLGRISIDMQNMMQPRDACAFPPLLPLVRKTCLRPCLAETCLLCETARNDG